MSTPTIIAIHEMVGYLILLITVVLSTWNVIRISAKLKGPSLRLVVVGLIHLQVLFGIVALIMYPRGGLFLLHPLSMIIAAVVITMMTRKQLQPRTHVWGYILTSLLLIVGVQFASLA